MRRTYIDHVEGGDGLDLSEDDSMDDDRFPIEDRPNFELNNVIDEPQHVYWDLLREFYEAMNAMQDPAYGTRMIAAASLEPETFSRTKLANLFKGVEAPKRNQFIPFPPWIGALAGIVWQHVGLIPDLCLASLYRDGADFLPAHVDFEGLTGPNAGDVIVAIFTFGVARPFVFRRIGEPEKKVEVSPGPGSMLVMRGDTQRYWTHEIPPADTMQPRLSISFTYVQRDPPEVLAWVLTNKNGVIHVGTYEEVYERWRAHAGTDELVIALSPNGEVVRDLEPPKKESP